MKLEAIKDILERRIQLNLSIADYYRRSECDDEASRYLAASKALHSCLLEILATADQTQD